MRKIHFISLMILFFSLNTSFACNEKKLLQTQVVHWMAWLNQIGQPTNPLSKADLEKYYARDIKVYVNTKLVAKNIDELYNQYATIRKENRSLSVQLPPKELLIDGNKAALHCVITLQNQKTQVINDVAILQFNKDRKIVQLWEMLDVADPVKSRNNS